MERKEGRKQKSKSSDAGSASLSSSWKSVFLKGKSPKMTRLASEGNFVGQVHSIGTSTADGNFLDPFIIAGLKLGVGIDVAVLNESLSLSKVAFTFDSNSGADEASVVHFAGTSLGSVQVAGKTISTYPMTSKNLREGSPVCDSFGIRVFEDGTALFCVADGCGWGKKSLMASSSASSKFLESMSTSSVMTSTESRLLLAAASAHREIVGSKSAEYDPGTTTILGASVTRSLLDCGGFEFNFISIGDCQAFLRKAATGDIECLSSFGRGNLKDAKDPGGRIGPCDNAGLPDLRNMLFGKCLCGYGDMVLIMSDGVADNFDPEVQGLLPSDCGFEDAKSWKDVTDPSQLKRWWCCLEMRRVVGSSKDVNDVAQSLISYCKNLTLSSRTFLEGSSGQKLPSNYKDFPGKVDHATCLCFTISN